MTSPTAARGVLRTGADSHAKRAAKIADRIIEDVLALGWPVGQVLGSEADLLERYQVSRAVFREAVRLVEHQQVARTRRGPGGGLVITEPSIGAVIEAVVLYLHRVDAALDEVFEARIILEELAAQLASERADEVELDELGLSASSGLVEPAGDQRGFHALLAAISHNAGLGLFVDVCNEVAQRYSPDLPRPGSAVEKDAVQAHAMIAQAVCARDARLARNRMRGHLQAEAKFLSGRPSTRQRLPDAVVLADTGRGKGAEAVARHITQAIVAEGLQPGDLVGTEPELIIREGVSRALLREAVRLLEYHHIARMRRGPGGGLFVMAPSTHAVTGMAAIYLARRGMRTDELAEMRTGVEVAITDLAAERIDEAAIAELREALTRGENVADLEQVEAEDDLHAAVAAAARNRVLNLVALVLIRLSRWHQVERLGPKRQRQIRVEVLRSHAGIAEAIAGGDRELARHRMQEHLEVLGGLMC